MLDDTQLEEFSRRGILKAPGVLDSGRAAQMEDRVWDFLTEECGVLRDDRSTWPAGLVSKLQRLTKAGTFNAFMNEALASLADQLLGVGRWNGGTTAGFVRPLVTFPSPVEWEVRHKTWHFDLPARGPTTRLTALRVLGFVNDVEPRGGGTLVVEGSHELVRRMVEADDDHDVGQSADVRKRLVKQSEWFAALARPGGDRINRFMCEGAEVDGVRVRVTELTGERGDLFLMHPWMFHNGSPNTAARPRMMVTHTLYSNDQPFWAQPQAVSPKTRGH